MCVYCCFLFYVLNNMKPLCFNSSIYMYIYYIFKYSSYFYIFFPPGQVFLKRCYCGWNLSYKVIIFLLSITYSIYFHIIWPEGSRSSTSGLCSLYTLRNNFEFSSNYIVDKIDVLDFYRSEEEIICCATIDLKFYDDKRVYFTLH